MELASGAYSERVTLEETLEEGRGWYCDGGGGQSRTMRILILDYFWYGPLRRAIAEQNRLETVGGLLPTMTYPASKCMFFDTCYFNKFP